MEDKKKTSPESKFSEQDIKRLNGIDENVKAIIRILNDEDDEK